MISVPQQVMQLVDVNRSICDERGHFAESRLRIPEVAVMELSSISFEVILLIS